MTRTGPRRKVSPDFLPGRLASARAYKQAAANDLAPYEKGETTAPIVSHIVSAAIAYGDCLTARFGEVVNSRDHSSAPRLLREVMKTLLPAAQEACFRRILAEKDAAQYRARHLSRDLAEARFADLEKFAAWAEERLA